jgi:hypothetical protein
MKIRTDFVSNSSSTSFIIAVNHKNYSFEDFLNDIISDTISENNEWNSPEFINNICKINRRNLDYHLHSSELLFLGDLIIDEKMQTYTKDSDEKLFNSLSYYIRTNNLWDGEKVVEQTDTSITLATPQIAPRIIVPHTTMEYRISFSDPETESDDKKKERAKRLVNYAKHAANGFNEINDCSELFFISKTTIYNTKALIDCGYNVHLQEWEKDLDGLLARLNNGESIYGIRQSQGGDGQDEMSIYALGGWSAPFNSKGKFNILYTECC